MYLLLLSAENRMYDHSQGCFPFRETGMRKQSGIAHLDLYPDIRRIGCSGELRIVIYLVCPSNFQDIMIGVFLLISFILLNPC